jgi:GntP family gluconate:H+ symporter
VTGPLLFIAFVISIGFILISVIRFKMNPFIALLLTCLLTGFMVRMPLTGIGENIALGFGNTLKGIGIVIGLGIIFGRILSESGATEKIAHTLVQYFGEKRSPLAVNITGFLVSIPVFIDAGFVILISVVKKLSVISRQSMLTLVTALAVGQITSHNMVVPTPGPVEVANNTSVSMGIFTVYAVLVGIPAALLGGWLYGIFIGKKAPDTQENNHLFEETPTHKSLPSAFLSFSILLLPIILILTGSIVALVLQEKSWAYGFFSFIGNKNIALLISVLVGSLLLNRHMIHDLSKVVAEAGEKAGMILLITGAGGSFGYIITASGIGSYLVDTLSSWNISIIVTGFLLSVLLKAAQGSSTVALIMASAILGPLISTSTASPILVALAICAGGSCLSLPNDSAFWVVSRFSNFTVKDTLKSWTAGSTISGLVSFAIIFLLSLLSDKLPGL